MKSYFAAAVLLFAAPAAAATPLWQKAEIGDTIKAIQTKYPDALPGSSTDRLKSGAECSLQLSDYDVADAHFKVCFYFVKGSLDQVTLKLTDKRQGYGAELTFASVLEALRGKYGTENNLKKENGIMTLFEADWYHSPVNVNLILIYVGKDDDATLNVNYQTRVAADSSKL